MHGGQIKRTTEVEETSSDSDSEYLQQTAEHRSQEIKELEPSRDTLKTLQSDLMVKGEFSATLQNKDRASS